MTIKSKLKKVQPYEMNKILYETVYLLMLFSIQCMFHIFCILLDCERNKLQLPHAFKAVYTTFTNLSTKYLMMCKVYTGEGGIKELYNAKTRGLSPRTAGQPMV